MSTIILVIIAIILTESIVEVLVKSAIFSPFREALFNRRENKLFNFIHELFDCGYCLSVWIGIIMGALLVDFQLVHPYIDWFLVGLLIHRLANILHNIIDRTR